MKKILNEFANFPIVANLNLEQYELFISKLKRNFPNFDVYKWETAINKIDKNYLQNLK